MTRRPSPATISSIASLISGSMPAATILIERDSSSGFARLTVNGRLVMEADASKFTPEHEGGWHLALAERHGVWISPETMAIALGRALCDMPDGTTIRNGRFMKEAT